MTKARRLTTLFAALVAAAALAAFVSACGEDDTGGTATGGQAETTETTPQKPQQDIVVLAQGEPSLSTLVKAVGAAKLVGTLQGKGPFTVFAPTNKAFDAVGKQQLSELLKPENRAQLKGILTYHVVPGELTADQLKDGQKLKTVQGETLTVSVSGGEVKINDATVVQPDVAASNGVVHVIDGVLTPSG